MKASVYLKILMLLIVSLSTAFAQFYGANKVQYEKFEWHFIQSEHFDVYFYEGGYDIAQFTAEVAESSYVSIKNDFQYEINERVAIILYNSHNDFQQTNVVFSYLEEGIGGVTELFKNRVVLPYEGNYDQFRHVIHHELVHAVMNDMLYGGSIQSLVTGQVTPVPLWFSEGLAEYESMRWDTQLDMVVRDATITGYLPPIDFLDYFPYQGGASVFRYIAQKYGKQKIGEIINKIKGSFRFEAAFKSALGVDFKDLTEEWQKQMKREYWPDIADRKEPGEISRALTDHREDRNFRNNSPSLSPMGDKLVYLSDMDGYLSIYLMDVLEGKVDRKVIQGEISEDFEELHFLTPGLSWSPDSKNFTFAAKAGAKDALYIYNFDQDEIQKYMFDLDGIFSTSWSPTGEDIAFVGNKNGSSDIYLFSLRTKEIKNITNDVFSERNPSWNADGSLITFSSDRGEYIKERYTADQFPMYRHNYKNYDIYIMNSDGSDMRRITDTDTKEDTPLFSPDGTKLVYVSDQNGIYNIYFHDLGTEESWPVTNLLTGAFQLTWDKSAQNLVYSSFTKGGWDLFLIKNPLELQPVTLEPTEYFKKLANHESALSLETKAEEEAPDKADEAPLVKDYSKYVFADMDQRKQEKAEDVTLDEEQYKDVDGTYKIKNYKIKFTPDIINGTAGYNTFFGLQGYTQIALSDLLGNHKIFVGTNLVFDLRNSNINIQYWYLPNRIDYGFNLFHISNFFQSRLGLLRFRNYGIGFSASRPFNKFTRLDMSLTWFNVNLEYLNTAQPGQSIQTILPSVSLVNDRIEWGITGPQDGSRSVISALISPKYSENGLDFKTFTFDVRKYFKLARFYSLAFRLNGGTSVGDDPQKFFLGGVSNWFNRSFRGGLRIDRIQDVFFSEFVTPLRGARFYEQIGNHFGLFNAEFRFPLIPLLQLGLPPIQLGNIQGVFFTDVGSAWDRTGAWRGAYKDEKGDTRLKDLVAGYGVGARVFFLGMLMKIDVAWRYDIATTSTPRYYWSIGTDF